MVLHRYLKECTISGRQVAVTTNSFCTAASYIGGSSVWNFLHVAPLATGILRWLINVFWNVCAPLGCNDILP